MKNTFSRWAGWLTATVLLVLAIVGNAHAAADPEKEAKHEVRRLQAQLAAAQKDKSALISQKEAFATEVEALKKQIGEAQSKGVELEKRSGGQRKQLAELTSRIEEAEKNLQEMTQLFLGASKTLDQVQAENDQDRKQLDGQIRTCEKKNTDFYRLSLDLMEKYQSKGVVASLLQTEPFTQLEKVRIQNLMQEYRDKADASRFVPTEVPMRPPRSAVSDLPPPPIGYSGSAATGNANSAPAATNGVSPAGSGVKNAKDTPRS
jgi:hypothetical protein